MWRAGWLLLPGAIAEVWFATEEDAEAAGFVKPGSQAAKDEDES